MEGSVEMVDVLIVCGIAASIITFGYGTLEFIRGGCRDRDWNSPPDSPVRYDLIVLFAFVWYCIGKWLIFGFDFPD